MIVQIYAFTRLDQALDAAASGVDHIGFVAGDYDLVHGELTFEQARGLASELPEGIISVALTMATEVEEILRMAAAVRPDIVHISTEPEDVDFNAMRALQRQFRSHVRLMKAVPVESEESIAIALRYAEVCDLLLLDTKVAGFPGVGATGETHDWRVSRQIVEASPVPVILAGGLTPENVGQAIHEVNPWGVDSNTGTNLPGDPVRKDMARVRRFAEAARRPSHPS